MAAQLEQLRREIEELAKKFRASGKGDLADLLKVDAFGFGTKAEIARRHGLETFAPSITDRPQFGIEIPSVSEEVYAETRRAIETATPGVFIAQIQPLSISDLLKIKKDSLRRLGYVDTSKTMRNTVPPEMEVFVDPNNFRIKHSDNLTTNAQKTRIAEVAAELKLRLPEAVRPYVDWYMVDPSTLSQLEDRYMDENNGALLLPNFFARTDIQTVRGSVAIVGRVDPDDRREVHVWYRGHGYDFVFGVLVGVLPRKLTV